MQAETQTPKPAGFEQHGIRGASRTAWQAVRIGVLLSLAAFGCTAFAIGRLIYVLWIAEAPVASIRLLGDVTLGEDLIGIAIIATACLQTLGSALTLATPLRAVRTTAMIGFVVQLAAFAGHMLMRFSPGDEPETVFALAIYVPLAGFASFCIWIIYLRQLAKALTGVLNAYVGYTLQIVVLWLVVAALSFITPFAAVWAARANPHAIVLLLVWILSLAPAVAAFLATVVFLFVYPMALYTVQRSIRRWMLFGDAAETATHP